MAWQLMLLLNVQSSPRGAQSASISVADAFLQAYRVRHIDLTIDTLNVWDEKLRHFDGEAIGAKHRGVSHQPLDEQKSAIWERIQSLAKLFQQAERLVLSVPMWNFAYPCKLKQLIDLVCQRHLLFSFENGVYGPLLKIQRALVIYGQTYSDGSTTPPSVFDHQTAHIEFCSALSESRRYKRLRSRILGAIRNRKAFRMARKKRGV